MPIDGVNEDTSLVGYDEAPPIYTPTDVGELPRLPVRVMPSEITTLGYQSYEDLQRLHRNAQIMFGVCSSTTIVDALATGVSLGLIHRNAMVFGYMAGGAGLLTMVSILPLCGFFFHLKETRARVNEATNNRPPPYGVIMRPPQGELPPPPYNP